MNRSKVNLIEVSFFLVILGIFFHSLYNLFYESKNFEASVLTPMTANIVSESHSTVPAHPMLGQIDIPCSSSALEKEVKAAKVRLNGHFCGPESANGELKHVEAKIQNTTNQTQATVFIDSKFAKYSTDYIALNPGKNQIHMEFSENENKKSVQDYFIYFK